MAESKVIDPQMTISEIFAKFPHHSQKMAQVMTNAGLHCTSCSASTWETLEAGMLSHGMTRAAVEELVKKLNSILEEPIDLSTITLTPKAAKKFAEVAIEEGKPGCGLRFGFTAGGCSGFEYILDFCDGEDFAGDEDSFEGTDAPEDMIIPSNGIDIHVRKSMFERLKGSVIDYTDGLHGGGFKITNPNAKSSCGCGKSQGF